MRGRLQHHGTSEHATNLHFTELVIIDRTFTDRRFREIHISSSSSGSMGTSEPALALPVLSADDAAVEP